MIELLKKIYFRTKRKYKKMRDAIHWWLYPINDNEDWLVKLHREKFEDERNCIYLPYDHYIVKALKEK